MGPRTPIRTLVAFGAIAVAATTLAACSSAGSSAGDGGKVTITYQTENSPGTTDAAQKFVAAFEKANPNITVKLDTRPQGTDGDNLIKTQLSTGEEDDVFLYNSGSLLQALHPDDTLVDLSGESWASAVLPDFKNAVSTDKGMYGAPWGTSLAGGVMYNKKVYDQLGLTVPTTWADFIANSKKIKDAGIVPILQTYGDTWTSQLFVLGDFANVTAQDPNWAQQYNANDPNAKYSKQPALQGFLNTQDVFTQGLVNQDYASLTNVNGLKELALGTAAQYPILSSTLASLQQSNPDKVNDIGFFALPAQSAANTRLTMWEPNGLYIPKSTTGAKLDAAKKLVAFASSTEACDIQAQATLPTGPFSTSACKLPADVPPLVNDEQKYVDNKQTGLALEFLSPIKGPNLEKILIAVGSGQSTAQQGAALYDDDVKKQAEQLGIPGW
ncbi:ABC transporter substrate-binding protein [Microbacterium sp. X-17]|uniref:ABC transporter substrate-binding protein n=1 Tax=Microbacterium sp. X-17 TaxID=3144404 RepID=UPI0031F51D22